MLGNGEGPECAVTSQLVTWKFDSLSAPGYRDWKKFRTIGELDYELDRYAGHHALGWHDFVPSKQPAGWCNYWLGGTFPPRIDARALGRRGDSSFFFRHLTPL